MVINNYKFKEKLDLNLKNMEIKDLFAFYFHV